MLWLLFLSSPGDRRYDQVKKPCGRYVNLLSLQGTHTHAASHGFTPPGTTRISLQFTPPLCTLYVRLRSKLMHTDTWKKSSNN